MLQLIDEAKLFFTNEARFVIPCFMSFKGSDTYLCY